MNKAITSGTDLKKENHPYWMEIPGDTGFYLAIGNGPAKHVGDPSVFWDCYEWCKEKFDKDVWTTEKNRFYFQNENDRNWAILIWSPKL